MLTHPGIIFKIKILGAQIHYGMEKALVKD